jgi:hypothetical protein
VFKQIFEEAIAESPPSAVDVDASLIRARRRARTRRLWAVGGATVAVFALAAGVGAVLGEAPAPRVADRPTAASSLPVEPSAIDRYYPRDLEFYRQFRWDAVLLVSPPKDLRTAVEESTAVVLARIVDVRRTRNVGEPAIEMSAFVLRPVEVISGRLRPELAGRVEVEFFGLPLRPGTRRCEQCVLHQPTVVHRPRRPQRSPPIRPAQRTGRRPATAVNRRTAGSAPSTISRELRATWPARSTTVPVGAGFKAALLGRGSCQRRSLTRSFVRAFAGRSGSREHGHCPSAISTSSQAHWCRFRRSRRALRLPSMRIVPIKTRTGGNLQ